MDTEAPKTPSQRLDEMSSNQRIAIGVFVLIALLVVAAVIATLTDSGDEDGPPATDSYGEEVVSIESEDVINEWAAEFTFDALTPEQLRMFCFELGASSKAEAIAQINLGADDLALAETIWEMGMERCEG